MLKTLSAESPTIAASVGRMVVGYTELEFGLLVCINGATDDFDTAFKALFRCRGESQRIDIADALGRQKFHALKLGTEFEMAIGAVRRCLSIRNKYAHSHWHVRPGKAIGFVDLEEVAKENAVAGGKSALSYRLVDEELVMQQEAHFDYADYWLLWLETEALVRRGKLPANEFPKPKQEAPPLLYKPKK